jgi:RHS repeat-associated protein
MEFGISRGVHCAADPRLVGDPVDTLTGAVLDRMLDFRLTGKIELRWYRYYDSAQAHRSFSVGNGCAHEYDRSLVLHGDELLYEEPVGRTSRFPALARDGEICQRYGLTLLRLSLRRYRIAGRGMPAMEFDFTVGAERSRLSKLLSGAWEVRFHYDRVEGRLVGITDTLGRQITAVEDGQGRLIKLAVEPSENSIGYDLIEYRYDTRGNLITTRNTVGHGYTFAYDAANRMTLRRGRKGFQFHYTYDLQGRCTRSMGDERLYGVALDYTVPGRLTHVTRPDRGRWSYTFDARGELETVRDPLGGLQRFVREPGGRLALVVDPNGNASQIVYDGAGAAIARLDPFGRRTPLPEPPGAVTPSRPRLAVNAAEYEHGSLLDIGRSALPTAAEVAAVAVTEEARALLITAPAGMQLGESGETVRVRPLGAQWWPRPEAGRVFNPLGKLVEQHDEFGRVRHWTYDASGNLASYRDFDGSTWSYDYGAWHLLRGLTNPLGTEVRLAYSTNAGVISATDGGGTSSAYRYDLCDRLIEVSRHGVVRDRYTRDLAGRLIAKHSGDGSELLRIEIGPGNLPIKRTLASGDEHSMRYDAAGRLVAAATREERVEIAYDTLGNRATEKRNGIGVEHQFSGQGRRPAESLYFEQFAVHYRWQRGGVVIRDPTGAEHEILLHGHAIIERRFASGSRETVQYDRLGRCHSKSVQRRGDHTWLKRYSWSGEGELLAIEDSRRGAIRFEYDAAHRLRRRLFNNRVEAFELDDADNLIAQPGLARVRLRAGNRLATANDWRFEYNDRDHLASREGPGGAVRYYYDSRDQLIAAEAPSGVFESQYDPVGRRTSKCWNGRTTTFFWYGNQLIAEQAPDGGLRLYLYIDPLAFTPLLVIDYAAMEAPPSTGQRYAVFADQIGTPCLLEDGNGNIVWQARISPYGFAEVTGQARIDFRLRFPGHYADDEIGLHYNRFRHYDPVLGRYLQSDPWGLAGGLNLYAYRTNPLHDVDVRGLGEEHDPGSPCPEDDEESPPGGLTHTDNDENDRPRLGQQEGQDIVDAIHDAITDPIAAKNRTTTVTETEDGSIIITSSQGTTKEQRDVIAGMQEPGGPLDGRQVLVPDNPRNPGYIPPEDRNLPPQGPNGAPTGAENHGEQRGIQAANYYDQHGDGNGQGHGPADTQWSKSDAGHQGQACPHCAAAQQANNVYNPTGVDPNPRGQ